MSGKLVGDELLRAVMPKIRANPTYFQNTHITRNPSLMFLGKLQRQYTLKQKNILHEFFFQGLSVSNLVTRKEANGTITGRYEQMSYGFLVQNNERCRQTLRVYAKSVRIMNLPD